MRERMLLRKGVDLLALSMAILFFWVAFSGAVVECPDEIVIDNKGWPRDTYEPVKLSHTKHGTEYKVQCKECHHVYKDGKNLWEEGQKVQKCSECHNVYKLGKDLKDATPEETKLSLFKAYHENCKGCHKKQSKGPFKCNECHAKKGAKK